MRRSILSACLCLVGSSMVVAPARADTPGEAAPPSPIDIDLSLQVKTMHYWRGYRVSEGPVLASDVALAASGLRVGVWSAVSFTATYKELDYFVSYSHEGFTAALWDIYNFSDGADSYLTTSSDIFDYKSKTTRHILDFSLAYQLPRVFPLKLFAATIVYGRDRGIGELPLKADGTSYASAYDVPLAQRMRNGNNRFSTYAEVGYPFETQPAQLYVFVGGAFAFRNVDDVNFYSKDHRVSLVNVGFTASKTLTLASHAFPTSLTAAWNPEWRGASVELALRLF